MKLKFKKISTVLLTIATSACFAFGFWAMTPATEFANAEDTTDLAITKFSISQNSDNIILVTPIVGDVSDIYEIGYTFDGAQPTTVQANTGLYYTVLKTQSKEFTAKTLFGEEFTDTTPMIIWEIENDKETTYAATAYYKEGTRAEDGNLYADYNGIPDEAVVGDQKILRATSTIIIKYLDGTTDEITNNPNAGGLSDDPSYGYDYDSINGVKMQAYVGDKKVTVTEEYLLGLTEDTVITYSEVKTGNKALGYNVNENRLQATTVQSGYSEVTMNDTVSGDFEISMDVKWESASWPVEAIAIEDGEESIQFVAGRIYVSCQKNWLWTKTGEGDGNSTTKWCRQLNGWTDDSFGVLHRNNDGGDKFNFKVTVVNGVASLYVDGYKCYQFTLSTINPNLNLNNELTVKLCVKDVGGTNPRIYLNNWEIKDDLSTQTITFKHLNGSTETITKVGETLSATPSKGYNYTSDNGVKVYAYVDGKEVTVTEDYLKSLTADTVITYDYKRFNIDRNTFAESSNGELKYDAASKNLVIKNAAQSYYGGVYMADTVTGNFELSMDVHWYSYNSSNWPIEAISIEDSKGESIQFIAGRIYVGCQANWDWINDSGADSQNGTANFKWCRWTYKDSNGNPWPWCGGNGVNAGNGTSSNDFGAPNKIGNTGCDFTYKVVVENGIAKMYIIDTVVGETYITQYELTKINPNFNVNDTLSIRLCVKDITKRENEYLVSMSNWKFTNK